MRKRPSPTALLTAGLLLLLLAGGCRDPESPTISAGNGIGSERRPVPAIEGPRLRVLGTVQDGGLPHAGCSCTECEAARHQPGRRRNVASLALITPPDGPLFLFDATPDVREQLVAIRDLRPSTAGRVDRSPVDGVLLTHAHIGHYTGLAFFGFEAMHTRDMPVFCTPRMARFLETNAPWEQLVRIRNIAIEEIRPGDPFDLGREVQTTAIRVPHRDEYADTVGFLLRGPRAGVLYIPDTEPWPTWERPLTEVLEGVDVALLDGTFYSAEELPGREVSSIGHPLITSTMDLLQSRVDAGTLEVYFTHLNHSNPALDPGSPERAEIESRGFHVLDEGHEFAL